MINRVADIFCKFITIAGCFSSMDEAERFANKLIEFFRRLTVSCSKLSIIVLVGVSEHRLPHARRKDKKTGKPGRPKVDFDESHPKAKVKPHVHVIFLCNAFDVVFEKFKKYISNQFKKAGSNRSGKSSVKDVDDMAGLLGYILDQSTYIRKLQVNPEGVLNKYNDFGLFDALQNNKYKHTVRFSSLDVEPEPTELESQRAEPAELKQYVPDPAIISTLRQKYIIAKTLSLCGCFPFLRDAQSNYSYNYYYKEYIALRGNETAIHRLKVPP